MRHPLKFTYLGFQFNALVDSGKFLDLSETHKKIEERKLFDWLQETFERGIDVSILSKEELTELEDYFAGLSWCVDEDRKMGVSKNGLCLLVAYCFEAAQNKPDNIS